MMSEGGGMGGGRSSGPSGGGRPRPGYLGGTRRRKKTCPFCHEKEKIDHKSGDRLRRFLSDRGKIVPRRIAGTCAKHQRHLTILIKRARYMALIPYAAAYDPNKPDRPEREYRDRGDREHRGYRGDRGDRGDRGERRDSL